MANLSTALKLILHWDELECDSDQKSYGSDTDDLVWSVISNLLKSNIILFRMRRQPYNTSERYLYPILHNQVAVEQAVSSLFSGSYQTES